MSNPPPRDIKADVSCVDCLNGLFYCFGPFHQFDRYYKDGHLDDCSAKFRDLRLCMKLKFADSEGTKALVRELITVRKSPTEGTVWQRRPSPPPEGLSASSPGGTALG